MTVWTVGLAIIIGGTIGLIARFTWDAWCKKERNK